MAVGFNLVNGATPLTGQQAGGGPSYMDALMKGFQGANLAAETAVKPQSLSEALLQAQLKNAHDRTINKYLPQSQEADINYKNAQTGLVPYHQRLLEAQANAANNPKMTGEAAQLFQLRNSLPPGKDRDRVDQMITQKSLGSAGTQLTVDPETGAVSFSQGGSGRSGGGNMVTTDQNGNKVVVSKPTSGTSGQLQQSGAAQAARDVVEPLAAFPYVGAGSELALGLDYYNASKGDKSAENKLINAAASEMIAHDMALNQLRSSGTRVTDQSTARQIKSLQTGWAAGSEKILNNLSPKAQAAARDKYNSWLDQMHQAQDTYAAQGFPMKVKGTKETNNKRLKYNPATGRLE